MVMTITNLSCSDLRAFTNDLVLVKNVHYKACCLTIRESLSNLIYIITIDEQDNRKHPLEGRFRHKHFASYLLKCQQVVYNPA